MSDVNQTPCTQFVLIMAGRGCTINVQLLNGSRDGGVEEISLPVALHSPLEVLQDQLSGISSIPLDDQVLILCDLSDVDRNNDKVLHGDGTLRARGIRNGSTLTLHAVSMGFDNAVIARKKAIENMLKASKMKPEVDNDLLRLDTPITCSQADHSYNGIVFDIKSKDHYEVSVKSISVAGMLGRVRVYARNRPWSKDNGDAGAPRHYWAHRSLLSEDGWELVADQTCTPSWDKLTEITFIKPMVLLPHERKALYAHSNLPDDLGIQYQSYQKGEVFARDRHVALVAGLGHTGSEPFETQNGWYKSYRGLAGSITYSVVNKGWNIWEHRKFPPALRRSVKEVLMCHQRLPDSPLNSPGKPSSAATATATATAMFPPSGAFDGLALGLEEDLNDYVNTATIAGAGAGAGANVAEMVEEEQLAMMLDEQSAWGGNTASMSTAAFASPLNSADIRAEAMAAEQQLLQNEQEVQEAVKTSLAHLPLHVVWNIMEFMHWDWAEVEDTSTGTTATATAGATEDDPTLLPLIHRLPRSVVTPTPSRPPGRVGVGVAREPLLESSMMRRRRRRKRGVCVRRWRTGEGTCSFLRR